MPYALLEQLSRLRLPTDVTDQEDIHKLLSLNAAGLVLCSFPKIEKDLSGERYMGAAVVTQVTAEGLVALRKLSKKRSPNKLV